MRIYTPTGYATPEEAMRAVYDSELAAGYNTWKQGKAGSYWAHSQFNGTGTRTADIHNAMLNHYNTTIAPQYDEFSYDADLQGTGGYVGKRLPPGQRRAPPPPPTYSRPGGLAGMVPFTGPRGEFMWRPPGKIPGETGFGTVRPPKWRPSPPDRPPSGSPIGPNGPRPQSYPAGTPGMGTAPPVGPGGGFGVVRPSSASIGRTGRAYPRY
jgi:hypothetical protein